MPVKAIAKTRPEPGVEIVEVPEPEVRSGHVKIKLEAASVCGTDLHIYNWDPWSAGRIKPPRIIGHEFCGTIVEIGEGVSERAVGDFVASESHIVCGHCLQCRRGQAHVCVNTKILGVDVDGGFATYAVIPWENARPTPKTVSPLIASFQDALGNAVHTALSGPVEGCVILITGMGPIGQFAVSVCKAMGAKAVYATEISEYRADIARQVGADRVFNPVQEDVVCELAKLHPEGVDGVLEMSGHPTQLSLACQVVRPGGRISLLGVYANNDQTLPINDLIFKGIDVHAIVGRRLWETWDQMSDLLGSGKLKLDPVVTHVMHFTQFQEAMELMKAGKAGKVVFTFE
ncbi:MAG: L-threonine 3-dehydrogenase [Armatimonadetes bacterium]|nr:L-threonine 3-dehydrogenase [Armatimonadota bacterium]MBS1727476.1 L-threonine 3-dehydrogenase [Armatimonadota bacterium]